MLFTGGGLQELGQPPYLPRGVEPLSHRHLAQECQVGEVWREVVRARDANPSAGAHKGVAERGLSQPT